MGEVSRNILKDMNEKLKDYCNWLPGYLSQIPYDDVNQMELWAFYKMLQSASLQLNNNVLFNSMVDKEKL